MHCSKMKKKNFFFFLFDKTQRQIVLAVVFIHGSTQQSKPMKNVLNEHMELEATCYLKYPNMEKLLL